jgi:hypothetical protein
LADLLDATRGQFEDRSEAAIGDAALAMEDRVPSWT